jgi:7,8-dihydroneopterin aldolase/epimerase/oxygenase
MPEAVGDRISVRGLLVDAHIGVTEEERARPQTLRLDVDIEADLSAAAASDDLGDTIDYASTVSLISDTVRSSRCKLLEHLASEVASVVSCKELVSGVAVEVSKHPPPVSERVDAIVVRIERPST